MSEITPIPGFYGYGATPDGNIWSCRPRNGRGPLSIEWHPLKAMQEKRTGYLEYLHVILDNKHMLIHRLVWVTFRGPLSSIQDVDHIDFNPSNNNIKNLQVLSKPANVARSWEHGRHARGLKISSAKLSDLAITEIKFLHQSGKTSREIAEKYGVSAPAIHYTLKRR